MPYYKQLHTATKPYIYPASWDTDVQAWLTASNAPLLDNQKDAINTFVIGLKSAGLWNKIHAFYVLKNVLPNDITNYWKYNLKNPALNTLSFICNNATVDRIKKPISYYNNFISYADTGYVFTSDYRYNKHLMVFVNSTVITLTINDIYGFDIGQATVENGVIDALSVRDTIDLATDVSKFRAYLSDNNNINTDTPATGFHCISRLNDTNVSAVRNGAVVIDNVASAAVAADNGQNILIGYAKGKLGFHTGDYASMGEGLTQAEMLTYNTLVTALDTAFYNMELSGEFYGNDPIFGLPKMTEYVNADVEIKRLEIGGNPLHLLAQRGDIKVAFPFTNSTVYPILGDDFYVSSDCGVTWTRKRWIFDDKHYASNVRFMHIFDDNTILFATRYNKLFRSTDLLTTVTEIALQNADGSPYVYHTPVNPLYPGSYFKRWGTSTPASIGGQEMLVWTNWGNNTIESQGANPTNIYYSFDKGATVKIAYVFGQNSAATDNGTATGGAGGNLLGDAGNPIVVYHGHQVSFNPADNSFWCLTGEENDNARWMRGVYNTETDSWVWTSMAQGDVAGANVRAACIWWKEGYTYWISDAYQTRSSGIYKILDADVGKVNDTYAKMVLPIRFDAGSALVWGDIIITGRAGSGDRDLYYSKDGGVSWYKFTPYLQLSTQMSSGWLYPDTNGWFAYQKYSLSATNIFFSSESYLIKFKI